MAARLNLNVSEILAESQSAKYPGRPVFNKIMKKVYSGEVKGIISWKLDRLARNPIDGSSLIWALDQGKITEIITPHNQFRNNSNDKFLMQIEFGMAKKYVDDLSDNVKRGNRAKLEKGWIPALPPLGYLNEPRDGIIVKDPERFPLVRKMWELLLQGDRPSQILKTANEEWGFRTRLHKKTGNKPLFISSIYKIFRNPFYYGLIERKEGIFQGRQEPMITEDEFWKAQEILGRKGRPRPKNHQFAFTGLIRCGECGSMITAEEKYNRYGSHYVYYRCTKKKRDVSCGQKYIELKYLEKQIVDYLCQIYIPQKLVRLALDFLKTETKEDKEKCRDIRASLEKTLADCRRRIDNLNQMRLKDLINDEEYLNEKKRLTGEKIRIEEQLRDKQGYSKKAAELTEKVLIFANQAREKFQKGGLEVQRSVLQGFGSNLSLMDKKLVIQMEKPLLILRRGLSVVNTEINLLEPSKKCLTKHKINLSFSNILYWQACVKDVRTYFLNILTRGLNYTRIPDFGKGGNCRRHIITV